MLRITLLTMLTLVLALPRVFGQDSTSSDAGSLTISGYADAYYSYNLNKPPHTPGLSFDNAGRIFDVEHNNISLGLVQTKFAYTKGKLAGVIDLTYGPNAALGNFGNVVGGGDLFIKQAYIDYNFTDKLKFTIGQFGTHIGYELIDAPLNFNYSLSYLFGNGPFYHTGAKLSYAFSDKFGVMVGVLNGWDAMLDFNKNKSFAAQVYVAPVEGWNLYLNYIGGDEKNGLSFPTITGLGDSIKTPSHLFDLTTTYEVSEDFKIGLNAAYGMGKLVLDSAETATKGEPVFGDASWYGVALYLNYNVSDKFGIGLRAEHFNDEEGVRYVGSGVMPASYNEVTLTGNISLADGMFLIKPEIRADFASEDAFIKYDAEGLADDVTNTQVTVGSAFIFTF